MRIHRVFALGARSASHFGVVVDPPIQHDDQVLGDDRLLALGRQNPPKPVGK
jgi:hypothetical protein